MDPHRLAALSKRHLFPHHRQWLGHTSIVQFLLLLPAMSRGSGHSLRHQKTFSSAKAPPTRIRPPHHRSAIRRHGSHDAIEGQCGEYAAESNQSTVRASEKIRPLPVDIAHHSAQRPCSRDFSWTGYLEEWSASAVNATPVLLGCSRQCLSPGRPLAIPAAVDPATSSGRPF